MKKSILALAMALGMAFSTSCFAAGAANAFKAEEAAADAFVTAITGGTVAFEQVNSKFGPELKKNLTAEKFEGLKKEFKAKIGTVKNPSLVNYGKGFDLKTGYTGAEELVYLGDAGKGKAARFVFVFSNENGKVLLQNFGIAPIELKPAEAPAKK